MPVPSVDSQSDSSQDVSQSLDLPLFHLDLLLQTLSLVGEVHQQVLIVAKSKHISQCEEREGRR